MTKLTRCPGWVLWILTALVALVPSRPVLAADAAKPIAVLSFASADHLMGDLVYLTQVAGRSDLGALVQLTGTSFVEGLDRTKPLGVLITIEEDEPKGIGFLAVPDLDKTLQALRDKFSFEVDDLGAGIKKLALGKGVYFKQQEGWVYVSDHPRHLTNLPADPVAMLGGLEKQYSVALRLYIQNIPQNLRDLGLFQLHAQIDSDTRSAKLEDPEIDGPFLELLQKGLKGSVNVLVNESDQITLGWAVDSQQDQTYFDFQATALPGSSLARQLSELSGNPSTLTGFIMGEAAATLQGTVRISAEHTRHIQALVDYLRKKALKGIDRDPQAPAAMKEIVNGVLDVLDRTVREGKTEIGASVVLAPKSFQFVAALRVADGRALADAFQKLFDLARQQPDVPEVKFYADKHRDVDFHTLTVPVSERDADTRQVLGEELDVVIGTGPQCLYFALGEAGDELLKQAIDKSVEAGEQTVLPAQLSVAVKPLTAFLSSLDATAEKPRKMAEIIAAARGGDEISLTATPVEHGIGFRLQIEAGVLEMLGKSAPE
ncbi:MAG: hypothetical protein ACYC6N_09865 [Pirellulaceae bacterium]